MTPAEPDDASAPLDPETLDRQTVGAVTIEHLRYTGAEGVRVPAYRFQPRDADGPQPAVILQHGANTSKDDDYIQAPARRWAEAGWTVLAIDLAEHGERVTTEPDDVMTRRRLIGKPAFVAQGVADLRRGVDLLAATAGVDASRIGFVGFSLGGMLGTVFCAREPRVAAVAVVIAGSFAHMRYWERGDSTAERQRRREAAEATDPAFFVAAIAPRPFLMVNTESDPIFPREAVLTLFAAAGDPKDLRWHPGTHHEWSAEVYKDVWRFLRARLGAP
jgi:uncharacterized protein